MPAEEAETKASVEQCICMPREPCVHIRFDRNELSGAFGDIGTDFPLIVGMILIAKLDAASVLIMFGAMQVMTGLIYGMPMPAQPLKAMAVLVITQKLTGATLYGGGLAIGIMMFVLAATGLINWLARVVPKSVVRGIQFGLGIQLSLLALKEYVPADGRIGYALAATAFVMTLFLLGNRRFLSPFRDSVRAGVCVCIQITVWAYWFAVLAFICRNSIFPRFKTY